jgi:hypothetical protein
VIKIIIVIIILCITVTYVQGKSLLLEHRYAVQRHNNIIHEQSSVSWRWQCKANDPFAMPMHLHRHGNIRIITTAVNIYLNSINYWKATTLIHLVVCTPIYLRCGATSQIRPTTEMGYVKVFDGHVFVVPTIVIFFLL